MFDPVDVSLKLAAFDGRSQKVIRDKSGRVTLPADERRVLSIALPEDEAVKLFIDALSTYKPIITQ